MVKRVRRQQGFTLLELMVAGAVALIILAGALALLIQGATLKRRQSELGDMNRDASRVLGQLATELRQAGLGRPRGVRYGAGGETFPPTMLLARPQELTFIVDLPRPNTNFNGISYLADDQSLLSYPVLPGPRRVLGVLNEFNGSCDVYKVGAPCDTSTSGMVFPPSGGNNHCGTNASSASCPWALKKYQGDEYIILADTSGRWLELQLDTSVVYNGLLRMGLNLKSTSPTVPDDMVTDMPNRAVVSTPDRVFYQLIVDPAAPTRYMLQRKQCWNPVGAGPLTRTSGSVASACADTQGTPWEVLLRNLPANGIQFSYRDGANRDLTGELASTDPLKVDQAHRRIRRVDIRLNLERNPRGSQQLKHTAFASIILRN